MNELGSGVLVVIEMLPLTDFVPPGPLTEYSASASSDQSFEYPKPLKGPVVTEPPPDKSVGSKRNVAMLDDGTAKDPEELPEVD